MNDKATDFAGVKSVNTSNYKVGNVYEIVDNYTSHNFAMHSHVKLLKIHQRDIINERDQRVFWAEDITDNSIKYYICEDDIRDI